MIDIEQNDYTLTDSLKNWSKYITSYHIFQAPLNQPPRDSDFEKNCESMLVKQGKQIRALYELQKVTIEKTTWIQNEIKKLSDKKKNVDLSKKVFSISG